ncbi:MAG TPA: aminoglycoside phosphotransferase family protein [Actinopolymorphaceae bacterium]
MTNVQTVPAQWRQRPHEVAPPPSEETLQWVREAVGPGSVVTAVRQLAVCSTALHAVDVLGATGVTHRLALRRFHNGERLRTDPWYLPSNEATVLGLLGSTDVPAPRLIAADTTPTMCDMPTLLTTRMPGVPPQTPADPVRLRAFAELLATIHAVDLPVVKALPPYRPYYDPNLDGHRRPPGWSRNPGLWHRVFEILAAGPPSAALGFIHRDYHPGQTLWNDDWLVGIVDWTTGCLGPRGIDLARMRLNLAGRYGAEAADHFLALYRSTGATDAYHPYWDLLDAADGIIDVREPTTMAAYQDFARFEDWVARSVAQL